MYLTSLNIFTEETKPHTKVGNKETTLHGTSETVW